MNLKNKFLSEYKRFLSKQFRKLCINIDENIFNPGNSSIWKEYYYINMHLITKKMAKLKENLDEQSQILVDKVFENFVFVFPEAKYTECCYFNADKLFAAGQTKVIPNDGGIKFLPANTIESLKNKDFIDGGAYDGDSAVIFNKYSPKSIQSFEPNASNYENLIKRLQSSFLNNVNPIKKGLGERKQTAVMSGDLAAASLAGKANVNTDSETIEVTDIDSFVEENNLNPGLIKLDIEGYELEAIKGATKTINKFKPVLLISIYHHPKDFFEIKPLIEELNPEYTFIVRKILDSHPVIDTMLIGYPQ